MNEFTAKELKTYLTLTASLSILILNCRSPIPINTAEPLEKTHGSEIKIPIEVSVCFKRTYCGITNYTLQNMVIVRYSTLTM